MTNFEKMMAEMTPEKMAYMMMCPYDEKETLPCLDDHTLRGRCMECCYDYLMKEAEDDAEM